MKKAGCILLLALPVIAYLYDFYSRASRFESATKALLKRAEEASGRATPKPVTPAEARRIAQENASRAQVKDTQDIALLLRARGEQLAQQAAAQLAGGQAAKSKMWCRAMAWNPTQQSESAAWWNVEFECRWPGDQLPNLTSVSVRLTKKSSGWVLD